MLYKLIILVITIPWIGRAFNTCDPNGLVKFGRDHNETYFIFALTQDCELVFARADQLSQFQSLAVDIRQHVTYCLPNLVQLHWQGRKVNGNLSLKLVFKRTNNQICVLPIDFPRENVLAGDRIFRYSLLNSLTYAVCSYMPNSTFTMEPELSFVDSIYLDVIYFVDPKSAGSFWTIRQFKVDQIGYLKAMETFVVKNFAEEPDFVSRTAGEHLLALDSQKLRLYSAHKLHKDVSSTCAYDLLFRPHKAKIHRHLPIRNSISTFRLNSYSVDNNTTVFVESKRNRNNNGFQSQVYVADRRVNYSAKCLLDLPYAVKFEIISKQSLQKLREKQLLKFDAAMKNRSQTSRTHKHPSPAIINYSKSLPKTTTTLRTTDFEDNFVDENQIDNEVIDESLIDEHVNKDTTYKTTIESEQEFPDDQQMEENMRVDNEIENSPNIENEKLRNDNSTNYHSKRFHFSITLMLISSLSIIWVHL